MNHHQRHTPPVANRALHHLSLLILAAMFPCGLLAMVRSQKATSHLAEKSPGYLATVGAPALRFQEPATIPAAPASVELKPAANPAAEFSPPVNSDINHGTPGSSAGEATAQDLSNELVPPQETKTKGKTSPPIIPDDTRTPVHPEDFLPFFRFPAAGTQSGGVEVIVPIPAQPLSPASVAPSSANYTQTPK